MEQIIAPQARLIAGMARADVTPPVGMYHRMWGAAVHDRSTGIHRPLTTTALWMQPRTDGGEAMLLIALDHCILERPDMDRLREAAGRATSLAADNVHVCLSHTHGAGLMSRSRASLSGGDRIGPYLDEMTERVARCAAQARAAAKPATLVCGAGHCDLARHRDYFDTASDQFVCGYNPHGAGDDTVVVGRLVADDGVTLGTIVNYACHPTTLAWQNTLVSPDYVGALRETVEAATDGAPCLFLQGASGDLGPREGFVGDPAVADRNGLQLGHAALSASASLPRPGTKFVYAGPVVSGATLGTWKHEPLDAAGLQATVVWRTRNVTTQLGYRPDLPTIDDTKRELARRQADEDQARRDGDPTRLSECRARVERLTRQLSRLTLLPAGATFPYSISVARTGGVLWVVVPGELYHVMQTELRRRFPQYAVIVATIADDWQPGYLPEKSVYGRGIYQEQIAVVAAGSLEAVVERTACELQSLVES